MWPKGRAEASKDQRQKAGKNIKNCLVCTIIQRMEMRGQKAQTLTVDKKEYKRDELKHPQTNDNSPQTKDNSLMELKDEGQDK
jgi:hypothetical protein